MRKALITAIATIMISTCAAEPAFADEPGEPQEKSIGFFLFTGVVVVNTGEIMSETVFLSNLKKCFLAKSTFNYVYRIGMPMMDTDGRQDNRVVAKFSRCINLSKLLDKVESIKI